MTKIRSIKKILGVFLFVGFIIFVFVAGVFETSRDNSLIDVEQNDTAVIECEYCQNVLPSDGFSLPVMGEYGGYSNWDVYCSFNDEDCEGYYCEHTGEDWNLYDENRNFVTDEGAPVYAVSNGVVFEVSVDNENWGNQILIQHNDLLNEDENDVWSQYSHLQNAPTIEVGDQVFRGQQIGEVGDTGLSSTGSHLHFEIRVENIAIDSWPASQYSNDCSRALEILQNEGYREPRPVLEARNYENRADEITPLMQEYRNASIINAELNKYFIERRAYFIAILVRALENLAGKTLNEAPYPYFDDIGDLDQGLQSAIRKALELDIIHRAVDRKFHPLRPIQRIEALAFIVRTFEAYTQPIQYGNDPSFDDIQIVDESNLQWWIWDTAQKGREAKLVSGYEVDENRYMCPLRWTIREEAVILVNNLIVLLNGDEPPVINSFKINNGAVSTTSAEVFLNNDSSGNATEYIASENADFSGAEWLPYDSAPAFLLSPGDEVKRVYFKIRNSSGIESEVAIDSIIFVQNSDLPIITFFEINNGALTTLYREVVLNNIATGNPIEFMASDKSDFSGAEWLPYNSAPTFLIRLGFGTKWIYLKVRNSYGESLVASDRITLTQSDTPFIPRFKINNGAETTSNLTVTLNNTATRNPTFYMASENSNFDGAAWQPYSHSPLFTLSNVRGEKQVFFKVKNNDGESAPVSDKITLELDLSLSISTFAVNNGAAYTSSQVVTLNNVSTGNPSHYKASERADFKGAGWKPYSLSPRFKLSKNKGLKTVYFKIKKKNVESDPKMDTIELK